MLNVRLITMMIIILTTLDLIFISFITNKLWYKNVLKVQKTELSLNPIYGLLSYVFIWFVLYYFILKDMNKSNYKNKLFDAFILGLSCYAIFDFTNLAIFKDYDLMTATIDMLWGGTVFYLTTYLINKIL